MSWFSRGCCPKNCTKCGGAPEEWVADFGAGGWTNRSCRFAASCTFYSGELTLSKVDISGQGGSTCNYDFRNAVVADVCCLWNGPWNEYGQCPGPGPFYEPCPWYHLSDGYSLVAPTLVLASLGATWKYVLWIWLSCDGDTSRSKVVYSSSPSSSTNCMADADEDGKITLGKDSEAHVGGAPCTGTLPATVDIWAA